MEGANTKYILEMKKRLEEKQKPESGNDDFRSFDMDDSGEQIVDQNISELFKFQNQTHSEIEKDSEMKENMMYMNS